MRHIAWSGAVAACLAGAVLAAGCLGPRDVVESRLFRLAPPAPAPGAAAPSGMTVGVRPLDTARPYDLRMAVMDSDFSVAYRSFDRWAELPSDALTRALSDALSATGRFSDVGGAGDMNRPDFILTGEIRAFHENRTVSPPVAELEARLELRASREPAVVWSGTLRETEPLDGADGAAFASAMNRAAGRLVGRAALGMADACPDAENAPAK